MPKSVVTGTKITKGDMDELAMMTERMSLEKKNKRKRNSTDVEMDNADVPKI